MLESRPIESFSALGGVWLSNHDGLLRLPSGLNVEVVFRTGFKETGFIETFDDCQVLNSSQHPYYFCHSTSIEEPDNLDIIACRIIDEKEAGTLSERSH